MADSTSETTSGEPSREEMMSALFAQMVIQQANMAMMLLGKMPHPQTGETMQDIEGARMFIDQLEMLEAKTKGNLDADEANLLKQSLMSLRLAFVEAVESPGKTQPAKEASPHAPAAPSQPAETKSAPAVEPASASDESKKKFSKRY